ncbi:MAG: WecB/TagA/CpsF family glycosyltransferase [Chthoniobacteraceae bacterium]|nr:WecB/TagA/CpsF family glycosyltransferase [Chthoniobacteraceae bacterium]
MQTPNTQIQCRSVPVLGVPLAATDYAGAVALTRAWAEDGGVHAVAAANTHLVTLARHDARFGAALARFDLVVPDGMPLIWTMNRRGAGMRDRVYGPTLMLHALAQPGVSHFLLGGTEPLLETLGRKLRERFPEVRIAGSYAPPFGEWTQEENARILEAIAASGARYVWVGLGCPKQELWIARHKAQLPPGVYFGVGAAFAFHAGQVRQAPAWMQKRGLEWLFRLAAEPRRLWKRYVVYNTLFALYLAAETLGGGSRPRANAL